MVEHSLIEKAARIAITAHAEQRRKSDTFPYIIHPFMVGAKLLQHGFNETVVAAALVHDVIEDTDIGEDELRKELGEEVIRIVLAVSENKELEWEDRKEKYVEVIRIADEQVKAVSASDKIHNLANFLAFYEEQGEPIWEKFSRGKEKKVWFENMMLQMFEATWDHPLVGEYNVLVEKLNTI